MMNLFGWDPVLVELNGFFYCFENEIGIELRDAEACVRIVHTFDILVGSEQKNPSVCGLVCLHALEHFLSVMEYHCGRGKGYILKGYDAGIVPALTLGIVAHEHMICEIFTEADNRVSVSAFLF